MGFQSAVNNFTRALAKPKSVLLEEQVYYSHLSSSPLKEPNRKGATPKGVGRLENPHKGKSGRVLSRFPLATQAQAEISEEIAKREEAWTENGTKYVHNKMRIDNARTKRVEVMAEYKMNCLDGEEKEKAAQAKLSQHAAKKIPKQELLIHQTDEILSHSVYDAQTVAREYLYTIGW